MDDKQKYSILKDEYLYTQSAIHDYDGRALTIKAWSVSFSFVAIGAAFAADACEILLVAAFSALVFWLIEGIWKTIQNAFYDRSKRLEQFFRGERQDIDPLQVGASWVTQYRKGKKCARFKRLVRIMFWLHVLLPHVVVALLAVILYYLVTNNFISI